MSLRSAAKLSYAKAQDVIDGKTLGDVPVIPEHDAAGVAHDIKVLHDIATQLRARRLQNGCVKTHSLRLAFKLDDNGLPVDTDLKERIESQKLIEEVGSVLFPFDYTMTNEL